MTKLVVYCDGGSRGNPGPAAIGAVIKDAGGNIIKKYGEQIGKKTNNEAEYASIIFALKKIKRLFGKKQTKNIEVAIKMDSKLVVSQLNGEFKIKEKDLMPLFIEVWNLKTEFKRIEFSAVPREKNKEADKLVNQALNSKENMPFF